MAIVLGGAACGGAPKTAEKQRDLMSQSQTALQTMLTRDPALGDVLRSSAGYAVFPNIGKGGFIAGAAHGKGVVYENGVPVGFVEMSQGSLGAQIGAQTFAELVVFKDRFTLAKLKGGQFSLGGNASAVALTAGAAASAQFVDGVAVFTLPKGGMMVELSVSGQQMSFQPLSG